MPFQSEKQRRYLWANEPEIARDWTDTYGSGIAKALGGRIPFAEGSGKTSIPEWNLAILKTALETATSDEERAEIQSQIDTVEGDIGTTADTLLGSGEAPTKGMGSKFLEFIFGSPAEGSIPTEQERIALINSMQEPSTGIDTINIDQMTDVYNPYKDYGQFFRNQPVDERTALTGINEGIGTFKNKFNMPNWSDISNIASGAYTALKGSVPWTWGAKMLSSLAGQNRGPVINPSTRRFMQNYNVGRNPTTGRMVGGPFAGQNLPGTSMFGSKTPKEMAQKWVAKYGNMQYKTPEQKQKQQLIKNIATMNQGPAGIIPKAPSVPAHISGGNGNQGNQTSGGQRGSNASGFTDPGKGSYGPWKAEGGLISLWPR